MAEAFFWGLFGSAFLLLGAWLAYAFDLSRRFTADSADGLRAELARMVGEIRDGRFEATPGPQCADCPALDLLCAGPALVTA